ncbi:MAG: ligase [Oscillochloris sp.]|nr:ligase [Oscillochloris sp.]
MERWRLLPPSAGAAQEALAAAEALLAGLQTVPQAALRWYESPGPALVIGAGQKLTEVDLDACAAAGVSLHRRASGGTAVLFVPGLLMQDIVLPPTHPLAISDVSESYRWLGEVWAAALTALRIPAMPIGVLDARADTRTLDPLLRRACFAGRSPYEILAAGRKLVGFSQVRRRHGVLLQVGIYTRWPGEELTQLLHLTPDEAVALVTSMADRVAGLTDLLATAPALPTIMRAFAENLAARCAVHLEPVAWRDDELAAFQFALPRYAPLPG